jgi:hypothetical protein
VQILAPIAIFLDTETECDPFSEAARSCGSPYPASRAVIVRMLQGILALIATVMVLVAAL